MKKLLLFVFATTILGLSPIFSAPLVTENFDYPLGNLVGNGNWVSTSATATDPIQVTDNALTYPDYQTTAIGKSVYIGNYGVGSSEKVRTEFTNIDAGSAYYSMLVNFSSVPNYTGTTGTYFACFNKGTGTATGTDYGYLVAKQGSSEGKIQFGVSKSTTSLTSTTSKIEFTTDEFNLNTTYLLVVKYELNNGTGTTVSLWVNPMIGSNAPTPLVETAYSGATTNVNRFLIRQGATFSAAAPEGTIDAIRVANNWADLFGEAPVDEPSITIAPTVNLGSFFPGESFEQTINIKAENLKEDITLSGLSGDVSVSPLTVPKEDAMSAEGFDLTLSLTAQTAGFNTQTLTATSGTVAKTSAISWYVEIVTTVADLTALRTQDPDGSTLYQVSADVIVSLPYLNTNAQKCLFLQDDARGLSIIDANNVLTTDYAQGDKINNIIGTIANSFGTLIFTPANDFGAAISQSNPLTPIETTVADIKANANLQGMLVIVKNIAFANAGGTFEGNTNFTQEGQSGIMRLIADDIAGNIIPALADLTGVISASSTALIAPREWNDVKDLSVSVEEISQKGNTWVTGRSIRVDNPSAEPIVLLNLSGSVIGSTQEREAVFEMNQPGIYLLRKGDHTTKVAIR